MGAQPHRVCVGPGWGRLQNRGTWALPVAQGSREQAALKEPAQPYASQRPGGGSRLRGRLGHRDHMAGAGTQQGGWAAESCGDGIWPEGEKWASSLCVSQGGPVWQGGWRPALGVAAWSLQVESESGYSVRVKPSRAGGLTRSPEEPLLGSRRVNGH